MKNFFFKGGWGLKLLALALAIVLYHSLKNETVGRQNKNETIFHTR